MKARLALILALLALVACGGDGGSQGASSDSRYCTLARALETNNPFDEDTTNLTDPDEARKAFDEFESRAREAIDAAPAEIKADLQLLVEGTLDLAEALTKVNFDFTKLDPGTLSRFGDKKFTDAGARVEAYNRRVCGISPSPTTS